MLQIIVARNDSVAVSDFALKSCKRTLQRKHVVPPDCGYFAPYLSHFEASSTAAVERFKRHL